jgi:hypothetical protein
MSQPDLHSLADLARRASAGLQNIADADAGPAAPQATLAPP